MEVQWEKLFIDQLEQRFQETPLAYFPYGPCEPHGPQLTVGTDGLRAQGLLRKTAMAYGGIVAPVNYWHIGESGGEASWAHDAVGQAERIWFTSVPPWTFYKNFLYHVRLADSIGFHAALFVTSHEGGFIKDIRKIVEVIQPHVGTRLHFTGAGELNTYPLEGGSGGHAGKMETSEIMVYNPECADITRIGTIEVPGNNFAMGRDVDKANKILGEKSIATQVESLGQRGQDLLNAYKEIKPEHKLQTFGQVEEMWDSLIKPMLPEFEMMQDLHKNQKPVPEDSRWYANWKIPKLYS